MKYGYKSTSKEGLKQWYQDYMKKNIKTSTGNIGLDSSIFTKKPVKNTCFEYSIKLEYFLKNLKNIIEELNIYLKKKKYI